MVKKLHICKENQLLNFSIIISSHLIIVSNVFSLVLDFSIPPEQGSYRNGKTEFQDYSRTWKNALFFSLKCRNEKAQSISLILKPVLTRYDVYEILCPQSFSCQELIPKFAIGNNSLKTKITFFFKFSPGYLLIIFYQLSKFEAPSCNSF